jgi:hypothetical protein
MRIIGKSPKFPLGGGVDYSPLSRPCTWVPEDYLVKETNLYIDLFILKNMGAAIIDFRVCPPLVKCQNLMFSGFIDTLMYGFSSTGVTIYCYFGLKFNDNTCCEVICKRRYNDNDLMTTNKLPVIISKSVYYNLYIYFLISYKILI